MKTTFTSISKLVLAAFACFSVTHVLAQNVTTPSSDSIVINMNMDAVYNRPFFNPGKIPVAVGGYLEANTQYQSVNGSSDGFSFQMRRLTLMLSSTIASRIKFLSEIEFEDGSKEIEVEYCAADFEFDPIFNLRGGIILNPIGAYNQNHDGPRWEFIDRPISAKKIIPTTLSSVGIGAHGKKYMHNWVVGYEIYLTNGFDDAIINNDEGRTSLHEGDESPDKFEESYSGLPMTTAKLAIRNRNIGEVGLSYMTGVYNKWKLNGDVIDAKRTANVIAVDFNLSFLANRLNIVGEVARVNVVLPDSVGQQYGNKQWGGYTDVVFTLMQRRICGWNNSKLNIGTRIEYDDFNEGYFDGTSTKKGDDVTAIVPFVSFRPAGTTVIRLNYRIESYNNLYNTETTRVEAIQFGLSTYF